MTKAFLKSTLLSAVFVAGIANAANFTVTNTDDSGQGSLRWVVDQANTAPGADTITFDISGTAPHTINLTSGEITITDGLTINGATDDHIIIDAVSNLDSSNNNERARIFHITNTAKLVTLKYLTLQNGRTSTDGGAIFAEAALDVQHCVLSGNWASNGGAILGERNITTSNSKFNNNRALNSGGAVNTYANITVENSVFLDNQATGVGGAITATSGETIVRSSTLSRNQVIGHDAQGGAIYGFKLTVENSTLSFNKAIASSPRPNPTAQGGSIYSFSSDISIDQSALINNEATNDGGAIHSFTSDMVIKRSVMTGNKSANDGGAISIYLAQSIAIDQTTLSNNTAQGTGGAISSDATNITIENSRLSDNMAAQGGAIYHASIGFTVDNSEFLRNQATGYDGGGAIFTEDTLTINDSTFANNRATTGLAGAINAFNGLYANNSTFVNNQSKEDGGAINTSTVRISNSTLVGNKTIDTTNISGGAIYGADFILTSNILLGNKVGTTINHCSDPVNGGSYNLLDSAGANDCNLTDNVDNNRINSSFTANSILGALRNNGCVVKAGAPQIAECVQTMALIINNSDGISNPNPTPNPAINNGSAAGYDNDGNPTVTLTTDQRGVTFNGTADIGAYEYGTLFLRITPSNGGRVSAAFSPQPLPGTGEINNCSTDDRTKCSAQYITNTSSVPTIALSASLINPNGDFTFKGWSGDCSGTATTINVTLNENKVCQAIFEGAPGVITVTSAADETIDDNQCTLREAIALANDNTINEKNGCVRDATNYSKDRDTIVFGNTFDTATSINLTQDEISISDKVIINGKDRMVTIDAQQQSRIFNIAENADTAIHYLTLQNGHAAGSQYNGNGGAIYSQADHLDIENSLLINNKANLNGGAIFNKENILATSMLTIKNSTLSDNSAGSGGAISAQVDITIINSTLSDNKSTSQLDEGGAVYADRKLTVLNSTFSNNRSEDDAGAISLFGDKTVIVNSTFSNNFAKGNGGAIFNYNSDLFISNSTLSNNSATGQYGGGAIYSEYTNEISNTTFAGNSATTTGGAISIDGTTLKITSTALLGNTATDGNNCYFPPINSSISGNGNLWETGNDCSGATGTATPLTMEDILETTIDPADGVTVIPKLADNDSLVKSGAPGHESIVQTIALMPNTADFTNPAIDNGNDSGYDNDGVSITLTADQRGVEFVNGVDIGAFEWILTTTPAEPGTILSDSFE